MENKRNPILVYCFEVINILGCVVLAVLITLNVGDWFMPTGDVISEQAFYACIQRVVLTMLGFMILFGISLILLVVDCFVIMKGIKGFKVSLWSILSAPAGYPVIRTQILKENKRDKTIHTVAGGLVFICNWILVSAMVQYFIRMVILVGEHLGFYPFY